MDDLEQRLRGKFDPSSLEGEELQAFLKSRRDATEKEALNYAQNTDDDYKRKRIHKDIIYQRIKRGDFEGAMQVPLETEDYNYMAELYVHVADTLHQDIEITLGERRKCYPLPAEDKEDLEKKYEQIKEVLEALLQTADKITDPVQQSYIYKHAIRVITNRKELGDDKLKGLAGKIKTPHIRADAYLHLSFYYYNNKKLDKSEYTIDLACESAEEIEPSNNSNKAEIFLTAAGYYVILEKYSKSKAALKSAIQTTKLLDDLKDQLNKYLQAAKLQHTLGQHWKAGWTLNFVLRSVKGLHKPFDEDYKPKASSEICLDAAKALHTWKQYSKSNRVLGLAVEEAKKIGDRYERRDKLESIISFQEEIGQHDEAEITRGILNKPEPNPPKARVTKKTPDDERQNEVFKLLSKRDFDEAIRITREIEDNYCRAGVGTTVANMAYITNPDKAKEALDISLQAAGKIDIPNRSAHLKNVIRIQLRLNDPYEAVKTLELYFQAVKKLDKDLQSSEYVSISSFCTLLLEQLNKAGKPIPRDIEARLRMMMQGIA